MRCKNSFDPWPCYFKVGKSLRSSHSLQNKEKHAAGCKMYCTISHIKVNLSFFSPHSPTTPVTSVNSSPVYTSAPAPHPLQISPPTLSSTFLPSPSSSSLSIRCPLTVSPSILVVRYVWGTVYAPNSIASYSVQRTVKLCANSSLIGLKIQSQLTALYQRWVILSWVGKFHW